MPWWKEKRTYRILFVTFIIGLASYFLYLIRGLFLPFILTIVLVYLLNPLVDRMERRGSSRTMAILALYLGVIIIVTSLLMYGVPRMVNQLEKLLTTIPVYSNQVEDTVNRIQQRFAHSTVPPGVQQIVDERINWAEVRLLSIVRQTADLLLALVGNLFNIALAPVLAFYIMKDLQYIKGRGATLIPPRCYSDTCRLAREIDRVIANFVRGHLIVVAIVTVLTSLALYLIGLEFAAMFGIFAGLAELIPYFGPFIGAVPPVALALLQSKWLALKVIMALFIVQQLEGNVISPKILGNSVGLHPLTIIIALLVGGHLFGLAGMLLAVPLTAIARIVVSFVWEKLA